VGLDGIVACPPKFCQGVVQSVVARQQQGQIVVGSQVLRVDGDRLPQVHLRLGPAALEVQAVAYVAEYVGVAGMHRQGLAIEIGRLAELALLVVDDRHACVGVGPASIAVECGAVRGHCLIEVPLLFGRSSHTDLDIGLLCRRDRGPAALRLVAQTQGRGYTRARRSMLAARQADQCPGRHYFSESQSST